MKIGIDGSRAFMKQRTGIEEYAYNVIKNLRDIMGEHEVVLYIRADQQVDFDLPSNWRVKKLRSPKFWTQFRLSMEMLFNMPDVLFVPAHTVPIIHPKNTVVVIHGLEYEFCSEAYSKKEQRYMRWVIKHSCRWAKKIICVSKSTKNDLVRLYGVEENKITVIYEGYIQDASFFEIREQASNNISGANLGKPYILFIGRIEQRKNIVRIVEMFEILKQRYNFPHALVLAGKPGYGYDAIRLRIEQSKFSGEIIELGYIEEYQKWQLLAQAEVFVFPTLYEGFGLPILEAQSMLVPVVASNNSSIPEVADGAALLVDPENSEEIAESVRIAIQNETAKNDLKKRGSENIKRFSWVRCSQEINRVLIG